MTVGQHFVGLEMYIFFFALFLKLSFFISICVHFHDVNFYQQNHAELTKMADRLGFFGFMYANIS